MIVGARKRLVVAEAVAPHKGPCGLVGVIHVAEEFPEGFVLDQLDAVRARAAARVVRSLARGPGLVGNGGVRVDGAIQVWAG